MWFPLLLVFLNIFVVQGKRGLKALPHTKCERTWEKVGCFKDISKKGRRALPVLLVNDRDPKSKAYDGHRIDWHAYEESMFSLACRCANATREKGWKIFGLQFYGECWSGENGESVFNKYGNAQPSECLQELVNRVPPCNISKEMECVGAQSTNYIYRLKDCFISNPCKNGGTCSNIPGSYKCTCDVKYTGKNCETDVNECTAHTEPCKNVGTCVNAVGGSNCKCPANYKGKNYDDGFHPEFLHVNECAANPCQNGANCTNTFGDYRCACDSRFTGKNCDQDVDECKVRNPCMNGAKCINSIGGYSCQCPANFQGKHCDEDVNECSANPCKNGAKCTNTHGDYKCTCDNRFTGKNCDQDVNECTVYKPCKNGGTCVNTVGDYNCQCPDNYKGKNCDEDVDECKVRNPCKNGAKCINSIGGYSCQCPANFKGKHCDEDVNECSANPCKNGAKCTNTHGDYKCTCDNRFTGKNCDQDVNECTVYKPCKNGGTCVNTVGDYKCQCPDNYKGKNCDEDVDECATLKPCKNGATCQNTRGSYSCACAWGFIGKNCDQIYLPPECKNPVVITDGSRSKHASGPLLCDRRDLPTVGKWHRFMGAAGNAMPTSCVPKNRCGTHAPGWLTGSHPTKEQGVVSRMVCFHWWWSCCMWSVYIKVRNCGEYYVYQLPQTPACYLRYCTENTGRCTAQNPCKNGGTCKAVGDDYQCVCPAGYKGKHCEQDVDECATLKPCKNGATCQNTRGSYSCACAGKFIGKNCDQIHPPPECKNPVVITDGSRSKHASGPLLCDRTDLPTVGKWHRFMGAAGNAMPTSCVPKHRCGTHAPGWLKGDHPTKEQGVVSRQVCFHWWWSCCLWNVYIKVRNCGEYYVYQLPQTPVCYLRYCTEKTDRCSAQNPCKNGGTCKAVGDDYQCVCPAGYKGKHCEQDVDECATLKPCKNGATCQNTRGSYSCACAGKFIGKNCDQIYLPPECKNPVVITDGSRSKHASGPARCDRRDLPTVGKWHRFMGAAGNAMPTSCVPQNRCGTHAPGWLTGGHPTKEQGVVSRKVCFHWWYSCCWWNVYIKVRNCGDYYVYQLPQTPVCYLRYCTEKTV